MLKTIYAPSGGSNTNRINLSPFTRDIRVFGPQTRVQICSTPISLGFKNLFAFRGFFNSASTCMSGHRCQLYDLPGSIRSFTSYGLVIVFGTYNLLSVTAFVHFPSPALSTL